MINLTSHHNHTSSHISTTKSTLTRVLVYSHGHPYQQQVKSWWHLGGAIGCCSKSSVLGDKQEYKGKATQTGTSAASNSIPQSLSKQSRSSGMNWGQPQPHTHQTSFPWWGRSEVKQGSQGKVRGIKAQSQTLVHVQCSSDQDLSLNTTSEQRQNVPRAASHSFFS